MAGHRFTILKSLCNSSKPQWSRSSGANSSFTNFADRPMHMRPLLSQLCYREIRFMGCLVERRDGNVGIRSYTVNSQYYNINQLRVGPSPTTLFNLGSWYSVPLISGSPILNHRSYSSSSGGKGEDSWGRDVSAASGGSDGGVVGNEWVEKVKDAWQFASGKTTEAFNELNPHVQQFLDAHPYYREVIAPVSLTLTGTVLAWVVMPRVLRKFHTYAMRAPAALIYGSLPGEQIPYEKSFWGALEEPVRYLITFMAFLQIGMMVAPTTIASHYIVQTWRGALILSFVWFLHRWKTNIFSRALASQNLAKLDRQKLLTLDKVSSVGLFVIGLMALAEACGVAVQSVLTVGGIGGVATAFAARDILGNVLSGLSMQFSQPFSLGDTIKAGSIEGQVVEMGLTTTSLLNAEKFPVIVPNSLFSSQVIVNKSRAQWRAIVTKIPMNIDNLDNIPQISDAIKGMLRSNSLIFLGKEAPYCFLSQIESSYAELTIGCNLKHMSKEEMYATQQEILLQSVEIIKQHGGSLGSTMKDWTSP